MDQSENRSRKLQIWYTNADQLQNKREDLAMVVCGEEPDAIFVTEVLPKASVLHTSALLSLPGYTLFSNFGTNMDELVGTGIRGMCIYLHDRLSPKASEVSFPDTNFSEQLWIRLNLEGSDTLYAGCIYRSPSGDPYQSVSDLIHLLERVCALNPSHLLIVGDFNLPQIDWKNNICRAPEQHYASRFFSAVQDLFLFQHVTEPTRFRHGVSPSLLDLVLTNEEGMIDSIEHCPGLGKSDHGLLKCQLACYSSTSRHVNIKWNFNKADFVEMNRRIEMIDWKGLTTLDVSTGYKMFIDTLFSLLSDCIPKTKNPHARRNIYMNRQALRMKRQKRLLWAVYRASLDPVDLARFQLCRNRLRGLTRRLRKEFESQLISNLKANPKAFWRYSNSRLKVKPRIGDLRNSSGQIESDDKAKAAILNDFFAGVFTTENMCVIPEFEIRHAGPLITDVGISQQVIEDKLTALKPTAAPGPDDVHPRMLRELSRSLSLPLALLFRKSLDTGVLPSIWKQAHVVPIHKKGSKQDPGNYRPVSLTSVPCKVLESLIRDELMQHLVTYGLISDDQHGFRPRRSCSTQLLVTLDAWSKLLENSTPLDVIYLDFKKAFDSVPHKRLLCKLKGYGVSGKLYSWIEAFLCGRFQQVSIGGCYSDMVPVTSGVPQGSVLGPLLFLMYVNDLPEVVDCPIKLFADDTKLYSGVSTEGDALSMQADLEVIVCLASHVLPYLSLWVGCRL